MEKLLKPKEDHHWDLEGIEFAIEERIGDPGMLIGRTGELEFLYKWADNIRKKISRSIAFLGRRKIGKSLILERLYNILYSEHKGVIPFYYEFREGERSGQEFYTDFAIRFYMQVIGYYTRDITWIRRSVRPDRGIPDIGTLLKEIVPLSMPNKEIITDHLGETSVIMAECKNYLPRYLNKITEKTVDKFAEKSGRLHKERFPEKELRLAFFSKHGFESKLDLYLEKKGIETELEKGMQK